jgi:hypothetical protein
LLLEVEELREKLLPEELRLTDEDRLLPEVTPLEPEALRVRTDLETFAFEDEDVPLLFVLTAERSVERLLVERVPDDMPTLVTLSLVDLVFVPSRSEVLRLVSVL